MHSIHLSGHAYGIGVSTRLTSYYRQTHRKQAVDVTRSEVIDCLVEAGVKNWVLMGLHGYVGYLPMPRATQALANASSDPSCRCDGSL